MHWNSKKLLEVDYYKRATVIVGLDVIVGHSAVEQAHEVAWLVGQVRQVGPQEISKIQPLTVSQLILRAGGFGDFADDRRVRLVHRNGANAAAPGAPDQTQTEDKGEVVDVKSIYQGNHTYDPIVQPNDLIIVPKKVLNF